MCYKRRRRCCTVKFWWSNRKRLLAALDESIDSKNNITSGMNTDDPKPLRLVEAFVYGTVERASFGSGAVTNVRYADLCSKTHRQPSQTNRRKELTDCIKSGVAGELMIVPVRVEDIICQRTFLVMNTEPFSLIMGKPAMNDMKDSLVVDKNVVIFRENGRNVTLPF